MIKIAITVEAFEAIASTLPLGSVGYENQVNERGERLIWLEAGMADRLGAMRGRGESYCRCHPADREIDAGANAKQRIRTLFAGGVLALALFGVARAGPFEDAQAADQKGDYATELQILRPLAEQGNALAQLGLGLMYAKGQGVPQDYAQALVWTRKAAEQGDARAQFDLGLTYANGKGVPQDYVRAHMWFNIAAAAAGASDASVRDLSVKWRDLVATRMTPAQIAEAQRMASEWKPTKCPSCARLGSFVFGPSSGF